MRLPEHHPRLRLVSRSLGRGRSYNPPRERRLMGSLSSSFDMVVTLRGAKWARPRLLGKTQVGRRIELDGRQQGSWKTGQTSTHPEHWRAGGLRGRDIPNEGHAGPKTAAGWTRREDHKCHASIPAGHVLHVHLCHVDPVKSRARCTHAARRWAAAELPSNRQSLSMDGGRTDGLVGQRWSVSSRLGRSDSAFQPKAAV